MTARTDVPSPGRSRPIPSVGFLPSQWIQIRTQGGKFGMLASQREAAARLGPVVWQWGGPIRFLLMLGPEANERVLLDRDRLLSARIPWTQIMGRTFPNGLLLRDGKDHLHHRRIMQAAFQRPVLKKYLEGMNPAIDAGLDALDAGGRPVLAFHAFKELTLDMAASIFLGEELGPRLAEMKRAFEGMVAASMTRVLRLPIPGTEYGAGLRGRKYMAGFLRDRLPARRAANGDDMFARLSRAKSEEGDALDDSDVVDHMNFLMMAAHDTTTSTLTSATYELAKHPEWQERLRDESRALGKAHADFDDLDSLTGATLVVREILRRYPPLPVIPRTATEEFEFDGYRVPKGTMVVVSPIFSHHMDEYWTDPFRFDPERFAPGRAEHEARSHLWIPFGGGAHVCLGMRFAETQIRAILHRLVLRYRWSVPEGYRMRVQEAPISKPTDGLPVTFERVGPSA